MGNSQRKAEIRKRHLDVEDDRRRREEEGRERRRQIEEENQRQLQAQLEQNERVLAEETRTQLAKVDAELAELEGVKDKHDREISEWKAKAHEQARRENAQVEAEAMEDMQKRLTEHAEEEAKLEKKKEALNDDRCQLMKTINEGNRRRTGMQNAHNLITDNQRKEHAEYLKNANANLNAYRLQNQQQLKALTEAGRAQNDALLARALELEIKRTHGGKIHLNTMQNVSDHDKFRLDCDHFRMHFATFKDSYSTQERAVNRVSMEMKRNKPLKTLPQPDVFYDAFEKFERFTDDFKIPDQFKEQYGQPLDEIRDGVKVLNDAMLEVEASITDYHDDSKKTPVDGDKLQEHYETMKENFDLIKTTVAELVKTIELFDIPLSNAMVKELYRQAKILEMNSKKRIGYGSSTGSKALIKTTVAELDKTMKLTPYPISKLSISTDSEVRRSSQQAREDLFEFQNVLAEFCNKVIDICKEQFREISFKEQDGIKAATLRLFIKIESDILNFQMKTALKKLKDEEETGLENSFLSRISLKLTDKSIMNCRENMRKMLSKIRDEMLVVERCYEKKTTLKPTLDPRLHHLAFYILSMYNSNRELKDAGIAEEVLTKNYALETLEWMFRLLFAMDTNEILPESSRIHFEECIKETKKRFDAMVLA